MAAEKWWKINLDYLPIKAHYFFCFGGMGGTVPFMQVLAKDLGISATAVGIVYTVVPFCVFFAKPLFGYITDFFRNIRLIIMLLLVVTALAFLAVLFIPPIEDDFRESLNVTALCTDQKNEFRILPLPYKSLCSEGVISKQLKCSLSSKFCLPMKSLFGNLNASSANPSNETSSFAFMFTPIENFPSPQTCDCMKTNYSLLSFDSKDCNSPKNEEHETVYHTYNFWLFALLAIIAGTGSATLFCLSDAACYEVLEQNSKLYGRQRLWATISWGITTFAAGYFNDIATAKSDRNDYSPGFYLMVAFVIVDLIILSRMKLLKANISTSICKDIGKIYQSHQTVLFSFGVYIVGALTGLVWNYQFWYLTDLGASQTLLGVVVAVQCLVAEMPFFFFSQWFIVKFGHFYCLIGSLAAFALRTGLYAILKNPWLDLPIDLLHGLTYAIFYSAMTLYATDNAPPGTEATMLGVLGGLFEGLGVATGSLLGGLGFDKIGGRQTFFVASMISLASVPFFTVSYNIIKRTSSSFELSKTATNGVSNYGSDNLGFQK